MANIERKMAFFLVTKIGNIVDGESLRYLVRILEGEIWCQDFITQL